MNSAKYLAIGIVLLFAVIFLVIVFRYEPSPPSNSQSDLSQPRVLSYVGHPAGYGYVVDVSLTNDGPDGWVKAAIEAHTFSGPPGMSIITSSQRAYLKQGESGTLQFAFEYGIDTFSVEAQPVSEGGPPEMNIETFDPDKIHTIIHLSIEQFPTTYERRNKENITFQVTFLNFTYEGTYGNGSKIYSVYINLTDVTDQPTMGTPLPSVGLVVAGSYNSYTGIETTIPYFGPMIPEMSRITFVIPESDNPYCVSWSDSETNHWLIIK